MLVESETFLKSSPKLVLPIFFKMSAGDQTPATKKVKLGECTYIFLLETVLQVTVLWFVSTVIPSSSGVRPQISSILLEGKEKWDFKSSCFIIS